MSGAPPGRLRLLVPVVALALGVARGADEGPPPVPPVVEPVLLETATVLARSAESSTAAITVLDREAIAALNVATVNELLRFVPGLDVVSGGPRGAPALAQIRGGDPNFTVVLLDGVPLNDLTDQFGGIVDLNSLPLVFVERIEIVRAPLSSFFGSTGLAGAINIITRRGGSTAAEPGFEIRVGDAAVIESAISLAGSSARSEYFVGLWYGEEHERVADDAFEQIGLQASAAFDLGPAAHLRLTGRATSWEGRDYPDASGGPLLGSGATRFSEHDEISAAAELHLGRQRLRGTVYRHDLDRSSPSIDGVFFQVPANVESTRFTHTTLSFSRPVVSGADSTLSVGAEWELERGENISTYDLGGPVDGSYRVDRSIAGLFAEWVANPRPVTLELGARVDVPQGHSTQFGLRAGVAYQAPAAATRLRLAAGRSYKLPSFFALASPAPLGGNPDLAPETATGVDGGVEHDFRGARLRTGFTVFYSRYRNLIDFDFASFQHVNRDEVRTRGAELTVDWSLPLGWTLAANVTRQDTRNRNSSQPLRHRPEWLGGTRLIWQPVDPLTLEFDARFVSGSFDEQLPAAAASRRSTGGYQLYGLSLSCAIARDWQAFARVDNLADKSYETLIGFPGSARSYRAGLRRRLD